jgi:hypothetical protein
MQIESRAATGSAAHNLRFCCCDQTTKAMTTIRAQEPERPTDTERARERERESKEGGNSDAAILPSFKKKKDKLLINYFRLML